MELLVTVEGWTVFYRRCTQTPDNVKQENVFNPRGMEWVHNVLSSVWNMQQFWNKVRKCLTMCRRIKWSWLIQGNRSHNSRKTI